MFFTARFTATAALALSACVPSIIVGENPQDDTASDSNSDSPPGLTTTDAGPTTDDTPTTDVIPSVCGDGLVGADEVCDDGNDEPNDGCSSACQRTGRIEWTVEPEGLFGAMDLEIDPAGRLVVVGRGDGDGLLLIFAPDGSELWRGPVPDAEELEIDEDGRILLAGVFSGELHAFQFDGDGVESLWSFTPEGPNSSFVALEVGPGAVYSAVQQTGNNTTKEFILRHDAATGGVVWQTEFPSEPLIGCNDLAFVDGRVVVVGTQSDGQGDSSPFLAMLDSDGVVLSTDVDDDIAERWSGVAPIAGNELALAGTSSDDRLVIRRLGVANEEIWTSHLTGAPGKIVMNMASDPGERIAIVGAITSPEPTRGVVRLHDATGALVWASILTSPSQETQNMAFGAAFGPDALFVVGQRATPMGDGAVAQVWLHRFALD